MADKKTGFLVGLLFVVIVGGVVAYLNISRKKGEIGKVLAVEMPMEQSVREVEVSIWETSNAIFYYMSKPSKTALEEYKKQIIDVEEFMAKYNNLINTDEEKQMVIKVEKMWADSVSKAEELIKLRDKMTELKETTWDTVHEVDDVIDYKIQPAFVEELPDLLEKEKCVREVEASIWESINAVGFYMLNRSDKAKREFLAQLEDVNEFWEEYKNLNLTSAEKPHIKELEGLWSRAVELMKECNAISDEVVQKELDYWESVHAVDDVVDFEIQEYLKKRIKNRRK
ncbi:MAG: hypothetical protein GY853_10470 [PVC group bacterium]|nr:hypothetical protein [PVC group bacterium]